MTARIRDAIGRWLCRRGQHAFVRRWVVASPSFAPSTWHNVCTRPRCGQEWKLVRDAWSMCRFEANDVNFRLIFGSDAQRAAEKERLFAVRYGSTPQSIRKDTRLSPQDASALLDKFQKKFPLAALRADRPEKGRPYPYVYDKRRHNRWLLKADHLLSSLTWYDQTRGGHSNIDPAHNDEGPGFKDLVRTAEAMARAAGRRKKRAD